MQTFAFGLTKAPISWNQTREPTSIPERNDNIAITSNPILHYTYASHMAGEPLFNMYRTSTYPSMTCTIAFRKPWLAIPYTKGRVQHSEDYSPPSLNTCTPTYPRRLCPSLLPRVDQSSLAQPR